MGDDEPSCCSFDWRTAVAYLHGLPSFGGAKYQIWVAPVVGIVGEHDEEIFIVLTREHGVTPSDAARKEGHAFILNCSAVQCENAKVKEVLRLNELRKNRAAIVCCVGRIVENAPIVFHEAHETGILDTVAFILTDWK